MNEPKIVPNPLGRLCAIGILSLLLLAMLLAPTKTVNGSTATLLNPLELPVLSLEGGSIPIGDSVSLPISLSHAPEGMSGFRLTVRMDNPGVAQFVNMEFPDFGMIDFTVISNSEVRIAAADVNDLVQAGAIDILLGAAVISSLSEGSTNVSLIVDAMDDEIGNEIAPNVSNGTLTILNVAPAVTMTSETVSIDEGDTFTASVSIADAGDSIWTVSVDYGDGTTETFESLDTTFALSHVYSEAGTYAATVTITDDDGVQDTAILQVDAALVLMFPGMLLPSQDLDGDGTTEDINGNSRLDFADVVLLFRHLDSDVVQINPEYFDFIVIPDNIHTISRLRRLWCRQEETAFVFS